MRFFFKVIIGLLLLIVLVLCALPFIMQTDSVKSNVLSRLEAATGRKVAISKIGIAIFPDIALELENVKIANPVWLDTQDTIAVRQVRVGVQLLPLLHKEVKIQKITLNDPVVNLVKNGNQDNWQFGNGKKPEAGNTATDAAPARQKMPIALDRLVIKNGSFSYRDMAANKPVQAISALDMTITAPDLNKKADIELDTVYQQKKINILLTLLKPLDFIAGQPLHAQLKIASDFIRCEFQGELAKTGNVPDIKGKLDIAEINLSALPAKQAAIPPAADTRPVAAPNTHWSDTPVVLDVLNSANVNLSLSIGKLVLTKNTLSNVTLTLLLENGVLSAETGDIAVYGGLIKAKLNLTSGNEVGLSALLQHIDAGSLLHDFANFNQLSGHITGNVALAARGKTERAMIGSLTGKGQFQMDEGKLKGKVIAALLQGKNTDETAFTDFSGTFTVQNGVVSNNDLKINLPIFHISGAGTLDLPNYLVHYVLKPGFESNADAVQIPLKVEGAIDNPSIHPDLQSAIQDNLKNPQAIKAAAKQLKQNLLNKDALRGLLR